VAGAHDCPEAMASTFGRRGAWSSGGGRRKNAEGPGEVKANGQFEIPRRSDTHYAAVCARPYGKKQARQ